MNELFGTIFVTGWGIFLLIILPLLGVGQFYEIVYHKYLEREKEWEIVKQEFKREIKRVLLVLTINLLVLIVVKLFIENNRSSEIILSILYMIIFYGTFNRWFSKLIKNEKYSLLGNEKAMNTNTVAIIYSFLIFIPFGLFFMGLLVPAGFIIFGDVSYFVKYRNIEIGMIIGYLSMLIIYGLLHIYLLIIYLKYKRKDESIWENQSVLIKKVVIFCLILLFIPLRFYVNNVYEKYKVENFKSITSKDIVISKIKKERYLLEFLNDKLKNDKTFILTIIKDEKIAGDRHWNFDLRNKIIGENLRNNKEFAFELLKDDLYYIGLLGEKIRTDKEFNLFVVNHKKYDYEFHLEYLLNREVIFNQISYSGGLIENGKKTERIPDSDILENLNPYFRDDLEIVKVAINKSPANIEYIGDKLKYLLNNKEIILNAVSQDGELLRFASDGLKNDNDVVMAAIKRNINSIKYVGNNFKYLLDDKKMIEEAINWDGSILNNASERLRNDPELILGAINNLKLKDQTDEIKDNKEVVLKFVEDDAENFKFASCRLRNDRDIIIAAYKSEGENWGRGEGFGNSWDVLNPLRMLSIMLEVFIM